MGMGFIIVSILLMYPVYECLRSEGWDFLISPRSIVGVFAIFGILFFILGLIILIVE